MDKKVVWVINQTAGKPNSGWGERHYFLAKYWVNKGYKVVIISGSYNHLFINQPTITSTFTIENLEDGITFCWVKNPKYLGGGFSKFWSNLIFTLKLFFLPIKKLNKPRHIIVSSMPIFPIINGFYFKKRLKAIKLFIEIRDLWPLTPIYLKGYSKNHPLILILKWFEKFAYRRSDEIVSVLPNANIYIDNISKKPEKFHWIPNGIDLNYLNNEDLPTEVSKKIPKNKFIIGYAGTIGMANALEYFIDASILMKNNLEVHFLLVGDGYLKNKFIDRTIGNQNISFLDKIPKNQVQALLQYFNVCYVGRYSNPLYTFGVSYNKYFDYMLAKKPILESSENINSPAELASCGAVIKPENAQAIVNEINRFHTMTYQQLQNLGEKGYSYVVKNHNFETLSENYLKLF